MKRVKILLFFLLLVLYTAGITAGSVMQVKSDRQEELNEYLNSAVSGYQTTAARSIKSVAADNAKLFVPAACGGLFKFGIAVIAVLVLWKGYTAGFSITAILRLYGLRGLVLCGANIISALVIIPALAYFGSISAYSAIWDYRDVKQKRKRYAAAVILLLAILLADSFMRGFLSSVFMKYASVIAKNS